MKIHHVGYLTKNMRKSQERFYVLGYTEEKTVEYDSIRDINISFLKNGEYLIELIEPASKASPMYELLKRYANTPYHFCYEVNDISQKIKELEDTGYHVLHAPEIAPCIDDNLVSFLYHPEIGIIELVQL